MTVAPDDLKDSTVPRAHRRTVIVTVVAIAFIYGLQMYAVVPAFGVLGTDYSLSLSQISLLVSVFFLGYAIAHIPAGILAAAYGFKTVAVVGSLILATSSLLFALSDGLGWFLVSRFIGGMAMSAIVGSALPLAAAWAGAKSTKLVVGGFVNGFGFTAGSALGLYAWAELVGSFGWRAGMGTAAVLGFLITAASAVFLRVPPNASALTGERFSWTGTVRCLRSRSMWAIGIGSVAGYGALFTASQLGPGYAETELGFSTSAAGLLSACMLALGIPAALLGGALGDRSRRFLPTLWAPAAAMVVLLALLPVAGPEVIWFVLGGIGIFGWMYFAPCTVAPTEYPDEVAPQDFGTALGLVLTLGNVGAIVFPFLYAVTTESAGPAAGWWVLSALAALATGGFFLAHEPRAVASVRDRR